jgi:ZIP family zinc transporter
VVAVIEASLHEAVAGTGAWGDFALLAATASVGRAVSLLGLVVYERWLATRGAGSVDLGVASAVEFAGRPAATTGRQLAILIALGIGLHNFAEGLAIGQSAAAGCSSAGRAKHGSTVSAG